MSITPASLKIFALLTKVSAASHRVLELKEKPASCAAAMSVSTSLTCLILARCSSLRPASSSSAVSESSPSSSARFAEVAEEAVPAGGPEEMFEAPAGSPTLMPRI